MAFNVFFLLYFGLRVSLIPTTQYHDGAACTQGPCPTSVCSGRDEAPCFQGDNVLIERALSLTSHFQKKYM